MKKINPEQLKKALPLLLLGLACLAGAVYFLITMKWK